MARKDAFDEARRAQEKAYFREPAVLNMIMTLVLGGALTLSAFAQQTVSYKTTSVTGCLEEQPGPKYVLRDVKKLKVIAELEPVVFPVQTFAKYMGKQVRLQGRLSAGNDPVIMRVRGIKGLPGPCAAK